MGCGCQHRPAPISVVDLPVAYVDGAASAEIRVSEIRAALGRAGAARIVGAQVVPISDAPQDIVVIDTATTADPTGVAESTIAWGGPPVAGQRITGDMADGAYELVAWHAGTSASSTASRVTINPGGNALGELQLAGRYRVAQAAAPVNQVRQLTVDGSPGGHLLRATSTIIHTTTGLQQGDTDRIVSAWRRVGGGLPAHVLELQIGRQRVRPRVPYVPGTSGITPLSLPLDCQRDGTLVVSISSWPTYDPIAAHSGRLILFAE